MLNSEADHPFLLLAGGQDARARDATRVWAIESLDELAGAPAGTLVLVPRHCLAHVANYELDVAVRVASDRGVAGLLLVGATQVPMTVVRVAERAGLVISGTSGQESLIDLVRRLDRLMERGQSAVLERADSVIGWLRGMDELDDHVKVLRGARARLGADLRLTWFSRPPGVAEPVTVGGYPVGWVHGAGSDDMAVSLALPAIAAAVGTCYERKIISEEAHGEAVAGLIDTEVIGRRTAAVDRALALGLNLNARHVVVCLTGASTDRPVGEGLLGRRHRRTLAAIVLREELGLSPQSWVVTRVERDLALLWTQMTTDQTDFALAVSTAERVITVLEQQYPSIAFCGGIGSTGFGVEGLRASAAEARAAARSALARGLPGRTVHVHGSLLDQMLGDLVTSSVSRRVIDGALTPLDTLSERSRRTLILTLSTYLDLQGSRVRAAEVLHLHPNAVGYRIAKAAKLLQADLTDPESRLVLQLACRVWLMAHEESAAAAG